MSTKVVLIQDDKDCKEIMRYILEEEGFEVVTPDVSEILAPGSVEFDLLVVDEFAEGKTGCDICKTVKSNDETCHKSVVLSSTAIGIESLALANKADAFLSKPFDINNFINLIRRFYRCEGSVHRTPILI
jgi:DNA-binding response OmpR family regulator